jgi:hypothetical protein
LSALPAVALGLTRAAEWLNPPTQQGSRVPAAPGHRWRIRLVPHLTAISLLGRSAGLVLVLASAAAPASAAAMVDGTYDISVGGFGVGVGVFRATLGERTYTATVTMRLTGLARFMSDGHGAASSMGTVANARPVPANYSLSTTSGNYTQTIRMGLLGGAVRVLNVSPAPRPRPDVVPVTLAHRRGIIDPVGALVMPMAGTGDLLSPGACARNLPVFDGRQRFDIRLAFDRMDKATGTGKSAYSGPVVVCRASYLPVAGHRLRPGVGKQAAAAAEVWLAPVAGTRVLVPWKISVKTPSGQAVIQARTLAIRGTAEPVEPRTPAPAEPRHDIRRAELRPAIQPDKPAEAKPLVEPGPPVTAGVAEAAPTPAEPETPPAAPAEAAQP